MAARVLMRVLSSTTRNPNKSKWALSSTTRDISFSASPIKPIPVTLFPGDSSGIGPEITESVKQVLNTAEVPIEWEEYFVGDKVDPRTESLLTWESLESVRRNGVGLKGPMDTPPRKGHQSLNFTLRKELGLYASVRPFNSLYGYNTQYKDVNLVLIRENPKCILGRVENSERKEDNNESKEERQGENSESKKEIQGGEKQEAEINEDSITERSRRVAEYAFDYAKTDGRNRVSAIHAANILKGVDDIFLECCRDVAKKYPEVAYEEVSTLKCHATLLRNPETLDVIVMPNYHAFIITQFCENLLKDFRLITPSCNIGEGGIVVAEALHGSVNPTVLLLSAVMILRHLKLNDKADEIHNAIVKTIAKGEYPTADLGGTSTTTAFTESICRHL